MLVYYLLYYIFFLISYIYIKYKLLYTINIYIMDPASIVSIILMAGLVIERILKHFKKSSCCGSSVEFDTETSVPDFSQIPINKK